MIVREFRVVYRWDVKFKRYPNFFIQIKCRNEIEFFFIVFKGATVLGKPTKVENIGDTNKSYETFMDYLKQIGDNTFK